MKHTIRKAFWNYEKEEQWLNEMAVKGMALTDYSWCRYVFEETGGHKYIYRIELLANLPTHPESLNYIRFLEENGIECVASYMRWIYLRKNAADGEFELYTDIESKIKHYKKINLLWTSLAWMELAIALSNIFIGVLNYTSSDSIGEYSMINIVAGALLLPVGILFIGLGSGIRRKIKRLVQEKAIRE